MKQQINTQLSRTDEVLRWLDQMFACYKDTLTDAERIALHEWEAGPFFTRTDDWAGWAVHIGIRPGARLRAASPELVRRRA